MAEVSWPSPDNGRAVTEAQFEQMAAHDTEDGFYMDPNGAFIDTSGGPVYADSSSPRGVKIRADKYANVRGFGYHSGASDVLLAIDANTSGSTRIDRVVLELNRATWNVRSKIVKGTAGSGVPPALTRQEGTTGVFQVPVARVTVPNNASVIAPGNVYVEGHRVGSRIRAWLSQADMLYPKLGEVGFDNAAKTWFGWDGTARRTLYSDTGWINMGIAWPTVWKSAGGLTRARNRNGIVTMTVQVARIGTLYASDTDGSMLVVLPSSCRPSDYVYGTCVATNGASARIMVKDANDGGEVWITDPSKDITNNQNVRFTMTFMAG